MNNNIKSKEQLANKIVDTNYKNSKNKSPFTQAAENAKELLSYTMQDGHVENNEGTKRLKTLKEAIEINEALDKNFQDHKKDDYLKKLKHPGYPKVSNPAILLNNVNTKNFPNKNNPTVDRYKKFKEDKKHKEEFEKEYGEKAIVQHIRAKENKNRMSGKAPYENFSSSDLIVAEHAKEKARKRLGALQSNVNRDQRADDFYPGAISLEDSITQMPVEHAIQPKKQEPGLSHNFTHEKLLQGKLIKEILDE